MFERQDGSLGKTVIDDHTHASRKISLSDKLSKHQGCFLWDGLLVQAMVLI